MAKKGTTANTLDAAAVEAVVRQKLLDLVTADGPMRLEPKKGADYPPLFVSKAGAAKEALARVKEPQKPLVVIVGTGKAEAVRLSAAGFARIADGIPEEKVGGAAKELAADLPPARRVEFLNEIARRTPAAAAELLPALEDAVAAEKAEAEARVAAAARRREQEEATRQALIRWQEVMDQRWRERIEALKAELRAEGGEVPATRTDVGPPPPPVAPPPTAITREDMVFRRDVVDRLVSAWIESYRLNKPEGRLFLETAMGNIGGLRQVGAENERVAFEGKYHEADIGVPKGTVVRVARPGWVLEEGDAEYRVLAAKVVP